MFIFWQVPVITKQSFQNNRRTFHEFLFQKYSKVIPKMLYCYENSYAMFDSWKKDIIITTLISIHNIVIIAINLFRRVYDVQCVPCSRKPLQLHVLLTTCNLTTCYKKCLITVIAVTRHYQRQFIRPSLRPLACH